MNICNLITLITVIFIGFNIFLLLNSLFNKTIEEGYTDGKFNYTRCNTYALGKIIGEIFQKHGISNSSATNSSSTNSSSTNSSISNIYLPCGYTNVERELKNLNPLKKQFIFGITGCDKIVSKNNIWEIILGKYGRQDACKIMPKTYLTKDNKDLQLFQNDYKRDSIYILKKNTQRQTGLKLCKDMQEILHLCSTDPSYEVIQEVLKSPLLVNGHKINLRVYLLITCKNGKVKGYRYNDGFIYYTPAKYNRFSDVVDENITTGYVSREMYNKNPLTHSDLSKYLEKKGYKPEKLYQNIDKLLKKVLVAAKPHLCTNRKLQNNLCFQLFGADIAPDGNLNCRLIEINKGPDMGSKDARDHQVKYKLQEDIFNLLGVLKYEKNKNGNDYKKGDKKRKNNFVFLGNIS